MDGPRASVRLLLLALLLGAAGISPREYLLHRCAEPRRCQGVTTPFWDAVFGTRVPVARVHVPRRPCRRGPLRGRRLHDAAGEAPPRGERAHVPGALRELPSRPRDSGGWAQARASEVRWLDMAHWTVASFLLAFAGVVVVAGALGSLLRRVFVQERPRRDATAIFAERTRVRLQGSAAMGIGLVVAPALFPIASMLGLPTRVPGLTVTQSFFAVALGVGLVAVVLTGRRSLRRDP